MTKTMMNKLLGIALLLFALNCKSTQPQEKINDETVVLIGNGNLYGSGSEGIGKANLVISSKEDWNNLMEKMDAVNDVSSSFSETDIDFSKFRIIAVFDGIKSTGGHSIALSIIENSDRILVEVLRKSPDGLATSVMTQPYCIAKIPKSDLPVVFK